MSWCRINNAFQTVGHIERQKPENERFGLSGFRTAALRMAADHGKFAFRSPHQPMQICRLRRYACGKATECQPPIAVEAFGIGFDYKREEAFAQSGYSLLNPLPVTYIRQINHNGHINDNSKQSKGVFSESSL